MNARKHRRNTLNPQLKKRLEQEQNEKALVLNYRTSFGRKLDDGVRYLFLSIALFMSIGFLYYPSHELHKVTYYTRFTYGSKISFKDLWLTEVGKVTLCSMRLDDAKFRIGDTVYVEKNFWGHPEAPTLKKSQETFFYKSKFVTLAIYYILGIIAFITLFFNYADQLKAKRRITLVLVLVILLTLIL